MPHYTKQDHLQLLARARAVLKSPADCDAKDIRALIEDLYAAEDRLVTEEVPWSIEVHVGTIDHNQGTNGYAALSRATLLAKMANFCREWWKEARCDVDHLTLSDEEVVHTYFANHGDDWYTTDCVALPGPEAAGAPVIETDRMLVLCNSHLRKETAERLEHWAQLPADGRPLDTVSTGCGFIIRMPIADRAVDADLPEELIAALGLARERGCHGVIFDRDASEVAMLEIFDW